MNLFRVRAAVTVVALLFAVYLPAFGITALVRPALPAAIALIIGTSLVLALAIIAWFAHRGDGFAPFGFVLPSIRMVVLAFGLGLPLGLAAAWLASALPSPAPFDVTSLQLWQQILYFLIAAPVQEEIIFRGLVQTYLQKRLSGATAIHSVQLSLSILITAVLFAVIHSGSGMAVVVGALLLSTLAGLLRASSGSLVPAIVVHSLFNVAAMLVPSA